jgi:hypothetical protein
VRCCAAPWARTASPARSAAGSARWRSSHSCTPAPARARGVPRRRRTRTPAAGTVWGYWSTLRRGGCGATCAVRRAREMSTCVRACVCVCVCVCACVCVCVCVC